MKNIFILSTDKPSRLYITNEGNFGFSQHYLNDDRQTMKNKNIYITSDDEIEEGDWYYHPLFGESNIQHLQESCIIKSKFGNPNSTMRKIILTTDQDLIKDGVQKIDDEFLEWFCQNPSCEEIEIGFILVSRGFKYKIIIPQEEPKLTNTINKDELGIPKGNLTEFIGVDKKQTLEDDFMVWDELFGILAWKFKPTKSGDMFLDAEKVFEELKSKFQLIKK